MQVELRIPLTKVFFFFQTSTAPFPSFFEYHVIFQDQSKGEYDIIGMTELILL